MTDYPRGAIKSKAELLAAAKDTTSLTLYIVDCYAQTNNEVVLLKTTLIPPFTGFNPSFRTRECLCEQRAMTRLSTSEPNGRFLASINLLKDCDFWLNNFCFLNYWDALAYSLRLKAKGAVDD